MGSALLDRAELGCPAGKPDSHGTLRSSSNPEDPMAQLAVVLLALFGQMERT
jgi:hypothetical protein